MGLSSLPQFLPFQVGRGLTAFALALFVTVSAAFAAAFETPPDAPLVIGNRTIHVFRATLGAFLLLNGRTAHGNAFAKP